MHIVIERTTPHTRAHARTHTHNLMAQWICITGQLAWWGQRDGQYEASIVHTGHTLWWTVSN